MRTPIPKLVALDGGAFPRLPDRQSFLRAMIRVEGRLVFAIGGGAREPIERDEQQVAQVRGVLAERIIISTSLDPFLSLKALIQYSGFSRRTLLSFLAASDNVLPHYRVNATGKIVVRRSDYDNWIAQFRRTQSAMDELIEQRRRERIMRRSRP